MSVKLLALLIAAVAGVTMAVQGTLNAALGKVVGLLEATMVVHLVGLVFATLLVVSLRLNNLSWHKFTQAPWYTYLGGILGVAIIYGVIRSIPKVGVAPATTAIILGQVFTAGLIDHLGLFGMRQIPFGWFKIVGIGLMATGAWLLLKD
jgi:transporter family-2 protein